MEEEAITLGYYFAHNTNKKALIQPLEGFKYYAKQLSAIFNKNNLLEEHLTAIFGKRTEKYYRWVPDLGWGERCWLRRSKIADVVLFDDGNGWNTVLAVFYDKTFFDRYIKDHVWMDKKTETATQ